MYSDKNKQENHINTSLITLFSAPRTSIVLFLIHIPVFLTIKISNGKYKYVLIFVACN